MGRDENEDMLARMLSKHQDLLELVLPLIDARHPRDLINKNRHRKGDDIEKRLLVNEYLKESAMAFIFAFFRDVDNVMKECSYCLGTGRSDKNGKPQCDKCSGTGEIDNNKSFRELIQKSKELKTEHNKRLPSKDWDDWTRKGLEFYQGWKKLPERHQISSQVAFVIGGQIGVDGFKLNRFGEKGPKRYGD